MVTCIFHFSLFIFHLNFFFFSFFLADITFFHYLCNKKTQIYKDGTKNSNHKQTPKQ